MSPMVLSSVPFSFSFFVWSHLCLVYPSILFIFFLSLLSVTQCYFLHYFPLYSFMISFPSSHFLLILSALSSHYSLLFLPPSSSLNLLNFLFISLISFLLPHCPTQFLHNHLTPFPLCLYTASGNDTTSAAPAFLVLLPSVTPLDKEGFSCFMQQWLTSIHVSLTYFFLFILFFLHTFIDFPQQEARSPSIFLAEDWNQSTTPFHEWLKMRAHWSVIKKPVAGVHPPNHVAVFCLSPCSLMTGPMTHLNLVDRCAALSA